MKTTFPISLMTNQGRNSIKTKEKFIVCGQSTEKLISQELKLKKGKNQNL